MIASDILVEALSRGLPGDRLVVDPDVLAAISHDDAEWAPTGQAAVGVRARSEAEVQHVVRTCAELDAPIVPRGAGTGLSGGANAVGGCVILDLSPMNQILEIDEDNLLAVVQPGVNQHRSQGGRRRARPVVPARPGQRPVVHDRAANSTRDRSRCSPPCAGRSTRGRSSTPARASQPPSVVDSGLGHPSGLAEPAPSRSVTRQETAMTIHPNARLLRDAYQAIERGDLQPMLTLLSEDIAWVDSTLGPLAGSYGKAEVPQFFGKMMDVYHGTLRVEITGMMADDDHGLVLTGESGLVDGEPVAWTCAHVWSFGQGRATRFVNYASAEYQRFWAGRP